MHPNGNCFFNVLVLSKYMKKLDLLAIKNWEHIK